MEGFDFVHRERVRFERLFPNLKIIRVDWFAFAAYPLSGGFRSWSLVPNALVRRTLRAERTVERDLAVVDARGLHPADVDHVVHVPVVVDVAEHHRDREAVAELL